MRDEFVKLKEDYAQLVKIVLENKEQINLIFERLNNIIQNYKEGDDNLLKKIELLKKYADDKIMELNTKLELILKNINVDGSDKRFDLSGLDDFMQKLVNLENKFDEFINKVNIDEVYRKLNYLEENKANKEDLEKVQTIVINLNKKSQEHQEEIDTIKYRLDSLYQELLNISKDPLLIEKNIIVDKSKGKIKENDKKKEIKNNIDNLDLSKYMLRKDFDIFFKENEFEIKKIWDEIKKINDLIAKLSKLIEEKVDADNLNELRDFLLSKIDELIDDFNKRFVEKNDYNKSIKYLEDQLKKIYSLLRSRKEVSSVHNADNWLLAKKPINGFSCAACESYIGDLRNDKNKYIPWNKLPVRDPAEKLYRMGNGFSKILNMLNFDNYGNASLNPNFDSENSKDTESDNESNEKKN